MVDLHLVSWNRPKMTELVIMTIIKNTNPKDYRLTVLDNGSEQSTQDMLKEFLSNGYIHELQQLPVNKGLEFARQQLFFRATRGEYFVDMDNDCLPEPPVKGKDWLTRLVELMDTYEDYAAISCRTQVMIGTGNIFEDESKELTDFPHPGGSIRIMRTHAVDGVEGWAREAPGRGAEERLICGRLHDAGWKTAFATHIPTLHLFGTRGDHGTDRWGYDKTLRPEDTGHSDIWHPVLGNGDNYDEVVGYSGEVLAKEYFGVDRDY